MVIKPYLRIGQIVPSSNTTMETEIPAIMRARETVEPERFTFHSSRMRMMKVTKAELEKMDGDSDRCALELSDARVDVLGYACLVAIMSMGQGYHRESERRLHGRTVENGGAAPLVTSAGALIHGLKTLGAKRIAVIAPYMKPLTQLVCDYIEAEGVEVVDRVALEIEDNLEVGARDPMLVLDSLPNLKYQGVDALVLSACVQMPSLGAIMEAERRTGLPVISASVCTAFQMMEKLGIKAMAPNGGTLLLGRYGGAGATSGAMPPCRAAPPA